MADLVSSLEKIITIGMEIKTAVETVQQNNEECCDIEGRVRIVRAILSHLKESTKQMIEKKMEIPENPAMDSALTDLEDTFDRALQLVKDCQKKNILCLFCTAGDLCKQLRRVQEEISRKMMSVQFATTVNVTFLVIGLKPQDACPPPPQQEAGEVKITQENDSTSDICGSGGTFEKGETTVEIGCGVPSAALSGFKQFSLSELKAATNNFSDDRCVGSGGFARVYKGELQDGNEVAIKKLYNFKNSIDTSQFVEEFEFCAKLKHKNIIKSVGYCIDSTTEFIQHDGAMVLAESQNQLLVLEYLPGGTLDMIIGRRELDWHLGFKIILGIAQGLCYLHEQNILHLDLKPSNILFNSEMDPVITDFGFSRFLNDTRSRMHTQIIGSLGYMAPEYMMEGVVSKRSDVFSFGIILHQIIGPRSSLEKWDKMPNEAGELMGLLHPTLHVDESNLKDIRRCVEIGLLCTDIERKRRPTMPEVLEMLSGEKELPTLRKSRTKRRA